MRMITQVNSGVRFVAAAALAAAWVTQAYAEHDDQAAAKSDPRVGAEVSRICFQRNIDGWKEADGYDRAVLLERGVNHWYLVQLSGACRARDFKFARAIGIDSRPGGGCVRRGDAIIVSDRGAFTHRCFISQINEWDDDAPAPGEGEDEAEVESGAGDDRY